MERDIGTIKLEAIIWAMFDVEKKIDALETILKHDEIQENRAFIESNLKTYREHFMIFRMLIEGKETFQEVFTIDRRDIFRAIETERERQDQLHPLPKRKKSTNEDVEVMQNLILNMEMLAVLTEEFGEVGSALQGEGDLLEELIQVASVCIRWCEELKQESPLWEVGFLGEPMAKQLLIIISFFLRHILLTLIALSIVHDEHG